MNLLFKFWMTFNGIADFIMMLVKFTIRAYIFLPNLLSWTLHILSSICCGYMRGNYSPDVVASKLFFFFSPFCSLISTTWSIVDKNYYLKPRMGTVAGLTNLNAYGCDVNSVEIVFSCTIKCQTASLSSLSQIVRDSYDFLQIFQNQIIQLLVHNVSQNSLYF